MTARLIFYYIYYAILHGVPPWHYFQINAEWYNKKKGFYSKIEIDNYIPLKWRLSQNYLDKNIPPNEFPVFLKPEWGQNSNGIIRVDSLDEFLVFDSTKSKVQYIMQVAAHERQEYEIFFIRNADNNNYAVLTITQSINNSDERYPINGIYNKDMVYQDLTSSFNDDELNQIKLHLRQLPSFRISRVGLRANSIKDLLNGIFHIIEINLFAPFPINLLDKNITKHKKYQFIKSSMQDLAKVSKTIPKKYFNRFVFFKKIIKHYQSKT